MISVYQEEPYSQTILRLALTVSLQESFITSRLTCPLLAFYVHEQTQAGYYLRQGQMKESDETYTIP
jgi:hypothetical protein